MQYQVPQFIEVEDKIFGPLTFKQFIYLAGSGGASLILFTLFPLWIAIPLCAPFAALGIGLAFYQVNGRPLIMVLEHAVKYFFGEKLYLWKQREPSPTLKTEASVATTPLATLPSMSESKLKDLAWSLNIKDREKMGVTTPKRTGFEL